MMLGIVQTLSQTIGACERIVQTPVPLTYVRHTSRFLSLFMFTLPYALVDMFGPITIVVTIVASWALFGILEIGLMIEDPFQQVLKVDVVADTLERDISETVRFCGAEELLQSLAEPVAEQSGTGAVLANPMLSPQNRHLTHGLVHGDTQEHETGIRTFAKDLASKELPFLDLAD